MFALIRTVSCFSVFISVLPYLTLLLIWFIISRSCGSIRRDGHAVIALSPEPIQTYCGFTNYLSDFYAVYNHLVYGTTTPAVTNRKFNVVSCVSQLRDYPIHTGSDSSDIFQIYRQAHHSLYTTTQNAATYWTQENRINGHQVRPYAVKQYARTHVCVSDWG